MKSFAKTAFLKDEKGQMLPWMALLMVVFIGAAGLTIDLGRGWVAYRELQAAADAAALAGVNAMAKGGATTSSVQSAVCQFSANGSTSNNCTMITTGTGGTTTTITKAGINTAPGLYTVSTTATMSCVTGEAYVPTACSASTTGYNVIRVVENTTIPTFFIQGLKAFGIKTGNTLTMNSTSSATLNGSMAPLDVAILVDTTASMGQNDPTKCGGTVTYSVTKVQCAYLGVQTLLAALPKCAEVSPTTGNCIAYNNVSLFTFPNVEASSVTNLTKCSGSGSGSPTVVPYTWPEPSGNNWTGYGTSSNGYTAPTGTSGTYQITSFGDDYAGSSTGTLSTSSPIVIATGGTGSSQCTGMQTPGGDGTYYAGAIDAAQEALMTASNGTTSKMVMIIMSDGDADSSMICQTWSTTNPTQCKTYVSSNGTNYGSSIDQCQQAIAAAQNATSLGTTVYTIAYQSPSSGCGSDSSGPKAGLSPCTTMKYMSSNYPADTSHFFSDGSAASSCGVGGYTLPTIFSQIEASFGAGRLIPNS
ncbi:MAG TPA: pilus assembly protein TadG-related protein [Terracidiphilus sp.]|jgi:Flp pilus assembly protein TadG|nr:pilus assembly protein TadG-related protein [Terracidiphilus sp.]